MTDVSEILTKNYAASSDELVTIVMIGTLQTATVNAGADVIMNFVKLVQQHKTRVNATSYDDLKTTVKWTKESTKNNVIITAPVTAAPPNHFWVTLNNVKEEHSGLYVVEVCWKEECTSAMARLHVISSKIFNKYLQA